MSEMLPNQPRIPELWDFAISLLEKIHGEVQESWNGFGTQLWLERYIKELQEVE